MKNLIPITDFLKQKIKKWMFVPCDENGYFLPEPKSFTLFLISSEEELNSAFPYKKECEDYKKAQERILFKGCTILPNHPNIFIHDGFNLFVVDEEKTIENIIHKNFELTETALKQIGL